MSTWMKLLPLELDSMTELIEPPDAVGEKEEIVAVMPETARKLYTLSQMLDKTAAQFALDSNYCQDVVEKKRLTGKATEIGVKARTAKALMWISVRDELDDWTTLIGIRTGWQVVKMPPSGFLGLFNLDG